jgi:DUF4097 and DUF4098 domain-containing protein YvlB
MKKIIWIPLLVGGLLFAGGATLVACNIPKAAPVDTPYDFAGKEINSISMDLSISDVTFKVGDTAKVVCKESDKWHHEVSLNEESKALSINFHMTKKWYNFADLFQPKFAVEVYLPSGNYDVLNIKHSTGDINLASGFVFSSLDFDGSTGDVNVRTEVTNKAHIKQSTGDISLSDSKFGELDVEVSTGKINLSNVTVSGDVKAKGSTGAVEVNGLTCNNLLVNTSTGDIEMKNGIATGKAELKASTGDVELEDFDASEVYIKTSTGDVEATFLTIKDVDASTDTGKKNIDKELDREAGGKCVVETDTGDIKLSLKR